MGHPRLAQSSAGISQNDLACLVEVEPITVGRMIDRLEARGLVERRADPKDRRTRRLHLTAEAMPLLDEMRQWKTAMTEVVMAGIDADILKAAEQALLQMKTNLTNERREGGKAGAGSSSSHPSSRRPTEIDPADAKFAEPDVAKPRLVSAK